MKHEFSEDGICIKCGFDGPEAYYLRKLLKSEIGIDEYNYRLKNGEFEHELICR